MLDGLLLIAEAESGLVVLRTMMSFSLHWELKEGEKVQQNEEQVAGASNASHNS